MLGWKIISLLLFSFFVLGCSDSSKTQDSVVKTAVPKQTPKVSAAYQSIEWTDLLPPEDLEAILNPPEELSDIQDGSLEDQIGSQIKNTLVKASDSAYQKALVSTKVIESFDGKAVKLPGFIVPLEFGENQVVTRFFLVPYFGACIHVPPPPPNQIIDSIYPNGLALKNLYDPFWISGVLSTEITENELAVSAYKIQVQKIEPYEE
jgi:hypothetical protein